MTPERWQQIDQLFHATLACPPAGRADFLASACEGDEPLREEVESLISFHDEAQSFIEAPAGDVAAELLGSHKARFKPGQQIDSYKIVRQLGSGGMGEVYLADDTRLDRKIALKLLPPQFTLDADRVRRFDQEARAASALNHPNIVTIHEIRQSNSTHFIATEFIDGITLREHLANAEMTLGEMLDVAAQVASALTAAHEAGIVHRDIKPENIMVRRDGFVKVLDFGLAKLSSHSVATTDSPVSPEATLKTDPGMVMGTVQYMSPEQARGEDMDHRTDIWSLGVVLYEMVMGRVPFTGETPSHVIVSILEAEPAPMQRYVEAPAELERIVIKALSKKRNERYQTATDLASDLKTLRQELEVEARLKRVTQPGQNGRQERSTLASAVSTADMAATRPASSAEYLVGEVKRHKTLALAALLVLLVGAIGLTYSLVNRNKSNPSARGKKSIAVLPLKPINAANRDEIYEIGIADSLIHRLGAMKGFVVRPLSATRKYADIAQDPIAAGREQQVDYVVASNYQLAGGKIRITAQLFNVPDGQIEETYQSGERDSSNIFAMQDAIADEIGKRLLVRFNTTSTSAAAKRETTNEEAYRLYLQGKNLMGQRSLKDMAKAVEYFEQAVRLDPNYARAYAGMAHAYVNSGVLSGGLTRADSEQIRGMINKALELDNNLAEAYAARADLTLKYEWDFPAVEKDLLRAIELEANNDLAHWLYALLSAYRGNFDKAIEEIETAQAIDPSALMSKRDRGRILYYSHRYDEAIVQLKRVIELDEDFGTAYSWLWLAHEMKGDYAGAYEWFIKSLKRFDNDSETIELFQKTYETVGWQGIRRKMLEFDKLNEHQPGISTYDSASSSAMLGEKDQAFEYLNKAVENREWWIIMLNVDPTLDSLRSDPRFAELVRRVGLK